MNTGAAGTERERHGRCTQQGKRGCLTGQWELVSVPEMSSAGGGGRVCDRQQMHTAGSREALQSWGMSRN